jgi:hypothetical protein
MRVVFVVLSILVVTTGTGTRAEAQTYPWCALYSGAMGGSSNCGFSTYQQCMADVSGIGGFCQPNDWYKPPATAPLRHKSHPHS